MASYTNLEVIDALALMLVVPSTRIAYDPNWVAAISKLDAEIPGSETLMAGILESLAPPDYGFDGSLMYATAYDAARAVFLFMVADLDPADYDLTARDYVIAGLSSYRNRSWVSALVDTVSGSDASACVGL
jgi:hypothetical protein